MLFLMRLKFLQLGEHAACREASGENLTAVYVYRSVLTGVIDLQNSDGVVRRSEQGCGPFIWFGKIYRRMKIAD